MTGTESDPRAPRSGGRLVEAWAEDVTTLNPVLIGDSFSKLAAGLCFAPLVSCDAGGEPVPVLAQRLPAPEPDGVTWLVRLRPDARWSDGAPLTANDVAFTYRLMSAPEYAALPSPWRPELSQQLISVDAPDPATVVFRTAGPCASFLTRYAVHGVLPSHILAGLSPAQLADCPFNTAPDVVSGAFRLTRWDHGKQLVFDRNPAYLGGPPRLDTFVYQLLADGAEVADALREGTVDAGIVDPSRLTELSALAYLRVVSFDMPSCTFLGYQLDPEKPAGRIFADPTVRRALLLGIDRQRMVDEVYGGQATVTDSVLPPTSWAYDGDATAPGYAFNPRLAAAMLARAGWRPGNPLAVRLTTGANALVWRRAADLIAECWREIGVEVQVLTLDFADLIEEVVGRRDFDAFLLAYDWGNDPDQSALYSSAAAAPGGLNCFGFRDTAVDELLVAAAASHDRERRRELYRRYQARMAELVPAPVLCYNRGVYAVNRRVHGYGIGPYTQFGARQWLLHTWVEADE